MAIDTEMPCSSESLGVIGRRVRTGQGLRYSERNLTKQTFLQEAKTGRRNLSHWLARLTLAFVSTTPSQAVLGGLLRVVARHLTIDVFDGVDGLTENYLSVYRTGMFAGA